MSKTNHPYTVYILLLFYWLAFNLLILHTPFNVFEGPPVAPINHAALLASATEVAPEVSNSWSTVSLPDDWHINQRFSSQHWYSSQVNLTPSRSKQWAIYLPHVTHNAEVYINGMWIGRAGRFSDPIARYHNEPLIFPFSASLLHPGINQILIRVAASHPAQGLLDQFYVGPLEKLKPAYDWKRLIRVDLIQWFTLLMYFMGALLGLFWIARPQDKAYGYFALLLGIWATHNLNLFVSNIPMSARLWEALTMCTLGWSVVVMIFFNHEYTKIRNPMMERLAFIFAVLGLGIFVLPTELILKLGYRAWDSFLIVFGSYAIFHLLKAYRQTRDSDIILMIMAGIPILTCGFHDILVVNNLRDRREGLIIQYSAIPAMLLFSWFLIRRFLHSIEHAELLAESLEATVREREQQIHIQYQQLAALEHEKILSDERERIMRDMHDGIGGQLLSLKALLQEQQGPVFRDLENRVQRSLVDLRLMIDSLDPVLNDFSTLLGMMRGRIEEQLDSTGMILIWDVDEISIAISLNPEKCLHLMRILQEAVTNAAKHSKAKEVYFSVTQTESNSVAIEIINNRSHPTPQQTSQFPENNNVVGRGITNMHFRAQQIGASLSISLKPEQYRVKLILQNS